MQKSGWGIIQFPREHACSCAQWITDERTWLAESFIRLPPSIPLAGSGISSLMDNPGSPLSPRDVCIRYLWPRVRSITRGNRCGDKIYLDSSQSATLFLPVIVPLGLLSRWKPVMVGPRNPEIFFKSIISRKRISRRKLYVLFSLKKYIELTVDWLRLMHTLGSVGEATHFNSTSPSIHTYIP